ncbi:DEAD/DEAH box helicase family protein [Rhizobium sp. 0TCS1.26]|uniref:DEAD/DEAH box helicase family protein n=1 Tax=Rhizobium sp. 0TCS1.26 TaxID=3142623 RepID=UPI003D2E3097
MGLRSLPTHPHLATSTHFLLESFYVPALAQSTSYDRGVGYFTSAWLRLTATGLAKLAENGGKARIIASPILHPADIAALHQGSQARENAALKDALTVAIEALEAELANDTLAALAWMIADGILDFRIAIPAVGLDGDFHDKFGIFRDEGGDAVAFHGSPNDSERAFRNYESISIYYSWVDDREFARVRNEQARFDALWDNREINVRVYNLPDAVRRNLLSFTSRFARPYALQPARERRKEDRWRHQKEAAGAFLSQGHGILEMATGTGKTRTALSVLNELLERGLIDTAIVSASGHDLLDQWYGELLAHTTLPVYRAYETHRGAQSFLNAPENAILLTSPQNLIQVVPRLKADTKKRALLICDEVHRLGSPALVAGLSGRLKPIAYRLGLSATPERTYDPVGSAFILDEIGSVVFSFGLEEAIERGILCPLDYIDLPYQLSPDDKTAIRKAIRRHHAKTRSAQPAAVEALYREIAFIRKTTVEKITPFRDLVTGRPELLKRCLIFVETAEYGALIQPILMDLRCDYHTYYQDDDRQNLKRFARGDLECLIACHRISEGIDIRSVNNIILFASARARLETVQRLGRCLRTDPDNEEKRAVVVDFIDDRDKEIDDPSGEMSADEERRAWFINLASIKKESKGIKGGGNGD